MDEGALASVEAFLATHPRVVSVAEVGPVQRQWGPTDGAFEVSFRVARAWKRALRKEK
jgi:hypothetical protein